MSNRKPKISALMTFKGKMSWIWKWEFLIGYSICLSAFGIIYLLVYTPDWTGFGSDSTINIERDSKGNIIKTVEVQQSGKTVWDWLSVLGVPLSLVVLGYWLQQLQQRQAADELKDEVLQAYYDRLSALLVDKNLFSIVDNANKATIDSDKNSASNELDNELAYEQRELLGAAINVIRARTLAILLRFEDDSDRKTSVIRFLLEAEVISKLNLNLTNANFSNANLSDTNFSCANLRHTNLTGVNFTNANLSGANLSKANFSNAYLFGANLSKANFNDAYFGNKIQLSQANLTCADLRRAYLVEAYLHDANLSYAILYDAHLLRAELSGANLTGTDFTCAHLTEADFTSANLTGATFGFTFDGTAFRSDLTGANFKNANLTGVNFKDADLNSVNFSGADLTDADFSSVKNWTSEQFNLAKLCRTNLPKACDLNPDRDCP